MRDKNCYCGVFMDKQTKSTIIELMKDCKTDEVYENILSELSDEKKIYAQCLWICRKYQFNRDQEQETKLNKIINRYGIDLDKIIEFTKTNLKHFVYDKHIVNIIQKDKRLNREKLLQERLKFVGDDAIEIVPIDNPSQYDGFDENVFKFVEAYRHNYEKFHLDNAPVIDRSFGNYLNIKRDDSIGYRSNVIILSKRVIDKKLFIATYQNLVEEFLPKNYKITKGLTESKNLEKLDNVDQDGIVKIGSKVNDGDILISGVVDKPEAEPTPEERLLRAIFGEILYEDRPIINIIDNGVVSDINFEKEKLGTRYNFIIDNCYNLQVGDILGDIAFRKGKIIEIISEKEMIERFNGDFDLVANFDIDRYVIRYNPIVKEHLHYSYGENYSLTNRQPVKYNNLYSPIKLNKDKITKFARHEMLMPLSKLIKYSQQCSFSNTIFSQIAKNGYYEFLEEDSQRIDFVKNYLLGIGFRLEFSKEKEELMLEKLSDDYKASLSYGEVVKYELLNYRTRKPEFGGLLCQRVFGPVKDYQCACGEYKRIRHNGVICDKCGVEVTLKDVRFRRFGHISLNVPTKSIFGEDINMLLVIPTEQRPCTYLKNGRYISSEVNDLYQRIIYRNNSLKKFIEIEAPKVILENEIKKLHKAVNSYEKHVVQMIIKHIKNIVNGSSLIPSLRGVCCVNNNVSNNKCLIPINALLRLFAPNLLYDKIKCILKKIKQHDKEIIKKLKDIIKNKKVLLFGEKENGDLLYLNIGITEGDSIVLNESNFERLNLQNSIIEGLLPVNDNIHEEFLNGHNSSKILDDGCDENIIDQLLKDNDMEQEIKLLISYLNNNNSIKLTSNMSRFVINAII